MSTAGEIKMLDCAIGYDKVGRGGSANILLSDLHWGQAIVTLFTYKGCT